VALPLIARPAMIVAGLGLVGDLGLGVYAMAVLLAGLAMTGVVSMLPDDGAGRVALSWVGRLIAAAAIVGGVLLVIDGVYDV
jgi:hypothetical protein